MDISKVDKIVVISLCDEVTKKVGFKLSQLLGMLYCDVSELIEYELVDKQEAENVCSKQYLENFENAVVARVASYSNVVIGICYDDFIQNRDVLADDCLIVFIKYAKKMIENAGASVLDLIGYRPRTNRLSEEADLTIKCETMSEDKICKRIIRELGGIV